MFRSEKISYQESGLMNPLVLDYLEGKENLRSFYSHFPDKKGFSEFIKTDPYKKLNRDLLADVLLKQSKSTANGSISSITNIEKLRSEQTFTITTGHQLCLFTGPLYFIYKILSIINLTEELKRSFPSNEFIPVYWMASEDHDFDEVNHFHVFGKKLIWEREKAGAVGKMKMEGIEKLGQDLQSVLGDHPNAIELNELFKLAYTKHESLADATRYLVNALFGNYGLVIADGDDHDLKSCASEIFSSDIFLKKTYPAIEKQISELNALGYKQQVNPREINCFYIDKDVRERIVEENGFYKVLNTSLVFTSKEMEVLIKNEPEKISPNVALRPLYQQLILPNMAYVGGPGEIAYWLQYKSSFEAYSIPFPVLMPRNTFTILDESLEYKMKKTGASIQSLFKGESEQISELLKKETKYPELEQELTELKNIYASIKEQIKKIDQSLEGAISSEEQKSIKGLESVQQKAIRSLKQQSEVAVNQIKNIHTKIFPQEIPQERFDNFSQHYLTWGKDFIQGIKVHADPFLFNHQVLLSAKSPIPVKEV